MFKKFTIKKLKRFRFSKKKLTTALAVLVVFVVVSSYFLFFNSQPLEAAWWNDSWAYRKSIAITNSSGSDLTDFQVKVLSGVDLSAYVTAGKVRSDLGDLRFTDINGEVLSYWIEDTTSSSVDVWVKMYSIPTTGATVYMYYGNPSVGSVQSGNDVFELFDDFNNGFNDWTTIANHAAAPTAAVSSGQLIISGTNAEGAIYKKNYTMTNGVIEFKARADNLVNGNDIAAMARRQSDSSYYHMGVNWGDNNTANISKDAAHTQISSAAYTFGTGTFRKISAYLYGTSLNVLIDDVSKTSATDSTYSAAGQVGIIFDGYHESAGSYVQWTVDDFRVRKSASADPSAAAPSTEEKGTGPIAYWAFDEGQGTDAFNSASGSFESADTFGDGTNFTNTGWWDNAGGGTITYPSGTNGFSGTYIQYVCSGGGSDRFWPSGRGGTFTSSGGKYRIDFDYRASKTFNVQVRDSTIIGGSSIPANTGNPTHFSVIFNSSDVTWEGFYRSAEDVLFYLGSATGSDYLQVDNLTIKQVGSSTTGGISGATWQAEDKCVSGKCLSFDGSNDTVTFGPTAFVGSGSSAFTASLWFRPTKTITDGQWYFPVRLKQDSQFFFSFYQTGGVFYALPAFRGSTQWGTPVDQTSLVNKWNHLEIIYNGGDKSTAVSYEIYINGSKIAPGSVSFDAAGGSCNDNAIGSDADASCTNNMGQFQGMIDEFKLYNYARSAAQIKMDYNAGLAGTGGKEGAAVSIGSRSGLWMSSGLVGHWKMDEASWNGTAGEVVDASGNGKNGASVNGAATAAGKFGNGGSFDGINDYVSVPDDSSLDITGAATYSAWIKFTSNGTSNERIMSKGETGSSYSLILYKLSEAKTIGFGDNAGVITTTNSFGDGIWHNVVAIHDGGNSNASLSIYVDGVKQAVTADGVFDGVNATDQPLSIGGNVDDGVAENFFAGSIDDVRVYNRALSDREIRNLYNYAPGPVGWWKMEEGSGTEAYDSSGNGITGTLSGPAWANGKFGKAISFDGSNDYVTINRTLTTTMTVSAWVKLTDFSKTANTLINATPHTTLGISLNRSGNGETVVYIGNGSSWLSTPSITANKNMLVNKWYHVAFTADGTTSNLYIDGVNVGSSGDDPSGFGSYFNIGQIVQSGEFFKGMIDDYKIYDYARTQKQIMEDMAATASPENSVAVSASGKTAVGYWKFDEGYGSAAHDSSPQKNDGIISGATWSNSGKFGKALNFDGSDDYITGSDANFPDGAEPVSISLWVKSSSFTGGVWQTLFSYGNGANNQGLLISQDGANNDGTLTIGRWGNNILESVGALSLNNWTYVTLTYDGTTLKLYLNGKFDNSVNVTLATVLGSYRIGRVIGADQYFSGLIDEVKIYNYALTQDEVNLDYNRGSSMVLGSKGTDASGNPSNSADRAYCPPGDTTATCGPVAEWKFEEGSGATANDTSGNSYDGIITGATWTSGKVGKSLSFDGNNDSFSASQSISNSYTVSMWINSGGNGATHIWEGQTMSSPSLEGSDSGYSFYMNNANSIGTGVIAPNRWYYIVATYDASSLVQKLYVDGILKGTNTSVASDSITTFYVASRAGTSRYWKGKIDNVKIYNYARSAAQVAWDYNKGKPVGWWKLNEKEGATAHDSSGNGNNGTLTNMDPANDWVSGKMGNALDFDGSNNYVTCGSGASIQLAKNGSVCLWFKPAVAFSGNTGTQKHLMSGGPREFYFSGSTSLLYYFLSDDSTGIGSNSGSWNTNWHHVCTTSDGTTLRMYIDGVAQNSTASLGTSNFFGNTGALTINKSVSPFAGQIDDVQVYNYALTAQQVKQVYNGGAVKFGQ